MTTLTISRQTAQLVALTEPKPTLATLPTALMQLVFNFLSAHDLAKSMHCLQTAWRYATRNDRHLDVSSTKITLLALFNTVSAHQKNAHPIHTLDLGYCKDIDGDQALEGLHYVPSLTKLRLPSSISDEGLNLLKLSKISLKHLSLESSRNVTDFGLAELAQTQFPLSYLNLQGCQRISSLGVVYVSKFPLTYLDIGWCFTIDDMALHCLSTCPLTTLKLGMCQRISDTGMRSISRLKLTCLYLSACHLITDRGFEYLNKMPLKELRLDQTSISDKQLLSLELSSLKDLDIAKCRNISPIGLQGLGRFPLEKLCLMDYKCITDDVIKTICGLNLTSLSIPGTNIDNRQLAMLSESSFQYLNIRACFELTHGFKDILEQFPALKKLEF